MKKLQAQVSAPTPYLDGIGHINAYMYGKTKLGIFLSKPYEQMFLHPRLGPFRSIENLWHYLNLGGRDTLRQCPPSTARNLAKLSDRKFKCDSFRDLILDATILKLQDNSAMLEEMKASVLPFDHYYMYGKENVPIRPSYSPLFVRILEDARKVVKGEREHTFVQYNQINFISYED